ncbi:hypothetical protein [Desulfovibrio psychrotolerans]|uniref:Uncharacterized protein n=1 Tax=Desulfovibrio psychrotolerans TaxID=415242 RepID=A0A7J0BVM3_9BACT|nr:hypothetical protein [Desulfovibrio psychrotolerans]GFM37221.1 hypothetical protein DSM19430T_19050 [Desulfovibrio psychrotolerans]
MLISHAAWENLSLAATEWNGHFSAPDIILMLYLVLYLPAMQRRRTANGLLAMLMVLPLYAILSGAHESVFALSGAAGIPLAPGMPAGLEQTADALFLHTHLLVAAFTLTALVCLLAVLEPSAASHANISQTGQPAVHRTFPAAKPFSLLSGASPRLTLSTMPEADGQAPGNAPVPPATRGAGRAGCIVFLISLFLFWKFVHLPPEYPDDALPELILPSLASLLALLFLGLSFRQPRPFLSLAAMVMTVYALVQACGLLLIGYFEDFLLLNDIYLPFLSPNDTADTQHLVLCALYLLMARRLSTLSRRRAAGGFASGPEQDGQNLP